MTYLRIWVVGLTLAFLAGCGGGGGSPGAGSEVGGGTEGGGGSERPSSASSLIFDLGGKTSIVNSGSDYATLTVTVLDVNRNVLPGVTVTVSLSPDGIFEPLGGAVTDAGGKFVGRIGVGGSKSNRIINAAISSGDLSRVASVAVTGSQIRVTALPSTPAPNAPYQVNLATRDVSSGIIPGAALSLSGTLGATGTVITDAFTGDASLNFVAPAAPGTYTLIVTGVGVTTTQVVEVASAGGSSRAPAMGPVSSATLTPIPNLVSVNSSGSSTNRARLEARFVSTGNTPISNVRARFELVAPTLGAGEYISTGSSMLYTDASGVVASEYVPGTRSSPTNGVLVRVCYSLVDFTAPTDCPQQVLANLTVAGTPLSITIGENNELAKGLGGIAYIRKHLIQVADSAGSAVRDAVVSVTVDITHYGKGAAWNQRYVGFPAMQAPTIRDVHSDYTPSPAPLNAVQSLQSSTSVPGTGTGALSHWCVNEDFDRNGFISDYEDLNRNGTLEPRKADVIVAFPAGNRTDANGQLLVDVIYPQNVGLWLAYTLRATTVVEGSEGDASKSYMTEVVKGDVSNGSFLTPPFGTGSCREPN